MTRQPSKNLRRWRLLPLSALLLLGVVGCASTPAMRPTVARNAPPTGRQASRAQQRCAGGLCFAYDDASTSDRH